MQFRIADTFTDSLAKLTNDEQKAVKTTAFDLQLNPANPGLQFHKLDKARDPSFCSVRVSRDIRLIVHRSSESLLLCYAAHHDDAYRWAERRKLETHPKTGAAQLVEVRETVREIITPVYVEAKEAVSKTPLFEHLSDDELLNFGVPAEWLADVRQANEDSLLALSDHLPGEAAEALLELATGGKPAAARVAPKDTTPFDHPDAQRRFRVMNNVEELERALEYPWEKWTIFLHPAQRTLVEREFNGPARVSGSAGTGKTIVALHRAVHLARKDPDARVLLTTFSEPLANALGLQLRRLISNEPKLGERLEVRSIEDIGKRLYELNVGPLQLASPEAVRKLIAETAPKIGTKRSLKFLATEWSDVVDAWQLDSWEAYRDVRRLGRRTRLSEPEREQLWSLFSQVITGLAKQNLVTSAGMFQRVAEKLAQNRNRPFDYLVVDESQDVSISQLRFLAAVCPDKPNALFFAGDLGQRIFQQPFSWKALGVDIRGRSSTLKVNYRTSHQIRSHADRLLGIEISDVDGNIENRAGTVSVFNGAKPEVVVLPSLEKEIEAVGKWITDRTSEGIRAHEIGVFVRSNEEIKRAISAVEVAGQKLKILDDGLQIGNGFVSIGTMHLAKGLEFKAVAVMACDDEVIPLMTRIEEAADEADLEEIYNTERHLLYVACTRARDYLLLTSGNGPSEFLDDISCELLDDKVCET